MKDDIYIKDKTLFIKKESEYVLVTKTHITLMKQFLHTTINFDDIEPFRGISFTGNYGNITIDSYITSISFVDSKVDTFKVRESDIYTTRKYINLCNTQIGIISSLQNDLSISTHNSSRNSEIEVMEVCNVSLSTVRAFIGVLRCKRLRLYDDVNIGLLYSYIADNFEDSLYNVNIRYYNHPNIIGKNYITLNQVKVVTFDKVKVGDIDKHVLSYIMSRMI